MNSAFKGHSAALAANIIFGLGVPASAIVLAGWLSPMGYIATRSVFAALAFWAVSLFTKKEKVAPRDLLVILCGGIMGFVISQTLTAWALTYTTPVYFSLIATLTPVAVMLLAALFRGEGITWLRTFGVALGIGGAILMVLRGATAGTGKNDLLGITLALLSLLTWAIYLIMTRKVAQRYSSVTQMKWLFLISAIITVPWTIIEGQPQPLFSGAATWEAIASMAFVVIFATIIGYFFIPVAMRYLRATTVSTYTNLQPVVASFVAFAIGQDTLTWDKPVAGILVLLSAYIVTMAPAKKD